MVGILRGFGGKFEEQRNREDLDEDRKGTEGEGKRPERVWERRRGQKRQGDFGVWENGGVPFGMDKRGVRLNCGGGECL